MRSGIDISQFDQTTRPQDDLFRHVNGKWLDTAEIPADRSRDGEFRRLHDQAELDIKAIIEELSDGVTPSDTAATDAEKIAVLYADFMDTDAINARGATPLEPLLAQIDEVNSLDEFVELLGSFARFGISGLTYPWVDTDSDDATKYTINLSQGGLSLPDEMYYRQDEFAEIRAAYLAHVERMAELAGASDAKSFAESVMDLETKLASKHWENTETRDATKTHNPTKRTDLDILSGSYQWSQWLKGAGVSDETFSDVNVRQPSFIEGLGEIIGEADLDQLQNWLRWHTIHAMAPYLSDEFVAENFAFYGTTLTGTPEIRERWKRGVGLVEGVLGEALGRVYVERHFPASSKEHMERLVAAIIRAFQDHIDELEWMSDETKVRALEKLATFNPKIGYPNKWRDYSALEIVPGDLIGNISRANAFEMDRELAKLGGPVDRDEWFMLPQTVNAYYNPGMNEIVFPAAILQPPFFDPEAEDAVNFGGIGAVIAHEISHGFDDQGSKYDGIGNLNNWWTDADREEFDARAGKLINQFNGYETIDAPGTKVNGELTVGENIGDLGGLTLAAHAYELWLDGAESPELDGLTGMQRVLCGWAQVWRGKAREQEALRLLAIDPHSPMDVRCNATVRNVPQFYSAFNVESDDELWLDPNDRVAIW
ncbi:MAG: M13-type metalloendopeptidase [Candidatus Nanopelagicales bacterium]